MVFTFTAPPELPRVLTLDPLGHAIRTIAGFDIHDRDRNPSGSWLHCNFLAFRHECEGTKLSSEFSIEYWPGEGSLIVNIAPAGATTTLSAPNRNSTVPSRILEMRTASQEVGVALRETDDRSR